MWLRILAVLCPLLVLALPADGAAKNKIAALAPKGLVYVLDGDGKELVARNADKPFVPASVAKIVTAWLAMEVLGGEYRFKTRLYLDKQRVLYVRGGGDPFLVSEELAVLADNLVVKTGKEPFTGIVIDTGYYPSDLRIPGITNTRRSYNALNSAFAANFNTIHAIRRGKKVRAAEKQTPITPIAIAQFRARARNGRSRISLAQAKPEIGVRYAGELLAAFIRKSGGAVKGKIALGPVPEGLEPVYVHEQSRALSVILKQMMLGSNNYIANQVFLELGAKQSGGPVSLDKSVKVARKLLARHGLADAITLVEGSGISRKNRFTARGLSRLLGIFTPHAKLLTRSKGGSRYKTGTLAGVRTLAGFAKTKGHGQVAFVIALKGQSGRLRFRLLKALEAGL